MNDITICPEDNIAKNFSSSFFDSSSRSHNEFEFRRIKILCEHGTLVLLFSVLHCTTYFEMYSICQKILLSYLLLLLLTNCWFRLPLWLFYSSFFCWPEELGTLTFLFLIFSEIQSLTLSNSIGSFIVLLSQTHKNNFTFQFNSWN